MLEMRRRIEDALLLDDCDQIVLFLIEEIEQLQKDAIFQRMQTVELIVDDIGIDGGYEFAESTRRVGRARVARNSTYCATRCRKVRGLGQ